MTISLQQALGRLRSGQSLEGFHVIPDYTPVEALEAVQLRAQGIEVPDGLIYTNYDAIDYSDVPDSEEGEVWQRAEEEE